MTLTDMSQVVIRRSFNPKAWDQSRKILKYKFPSVQTGICTGFPPSTSVFLLSLSVPFYESSILILLYQKDKRADPGNL